MPSHLPLEAIRAVLSADILLVEYFRVRDRIVACVLGPNTLEIIPVTLESRVASLLRLLHLPCARTTSAT